MEALLKNIRIPKMVKVRQHFPSSSVRDVVRTLQDELKQREVIERIKRGDRVAIAVGSRGIANLVVIVREMVAAVKERGAYPFIVPAMGSHGGATGEGQKHILAQLNVTEQATSAPIVAEMDVIQLGTTKTGWPVYIDKNAHAADAIIVIGRIKPHTSFRARYESGLAKMIAVGLGKQKGAEVVHAAGIEEIPVRVEAIARELLEKSKIIFGVATIENAYGETDKIVAIPKERIMKEEPKLLEEARKRMPSILFNRCDVLIVDEMGKNISGSGMDPNIIRRNYTGTLQYEPLAERIAVLDLTRESDGNANGIGNADICTRRLFEKISFQATYPNPLTNRLAESVKIPIVMENDRLAIQAAIKTCLNANDERIKLIRIKNTLDLEYLYISEALIEEARRHPAIEILGEPQKMNFNEDSNLF